MLQTAYIKENKALIIERFQKRNFDGEAIINQILKLDDERKSTQQKLDSQLAEGNRLAKEIGELFKSGKQDAANMIKEQSKALKKEGIPVLHYYSMGKSDNIKTIASQVY